MRQALFALAFLVACACGGGAANRSADITGFVTGVSGRADSVTTFRDLAQGKAQAPVIIR